jgi:hypothetical protein
VSEPLSLDVRRQLDELQLGTIAEYLALRLGLRRGELRIQIKDGRFDRGRAVVSFDDLR